MVSGISSLGIDHVGVLGKTVGEIAWQKGGIFKVSVMATVHHPSYENALRKAFQR